MCAHSLRHLRLGEAGLLPCLEQLAKQGKLFALQPFNRGAHTGTAQEFLNDLIMGVQV